MNKYTPGRYTFVTRRSRAGFGLFTQSAIPKGACVIEYKGKTLTQEQDDKSESHYLFLVSKAKTIDGWIPGNKAKYINHSCRPNCEIVIRKGRVWVMSLRNIQPGEELTYDYDKEYFEAYIKPKGCVCPKCSPQLYPQKKH
jgi:SET domain-containing protein